MEALWAPWRIDYILGPKPDHCVFCLPQGREEDAKRLVLCRGKATFVILNKFPYNNAHIMVTPYRHVMDFCSLAPEESAELMWMLQKSCAILQENLKPQGLNVGLNLGEAAGAGIREHLHFHIVPRWNGDSSFIAVTASVRVIPQHLDDCYAMLRPHFARLEGELP